MQPYNIIALLLNVISLYKISDNDEAGMKHNLLRRSLRNFTRKLKCV